MCKGFEKAVRTSIEAENAVLAGKVSGILQSIHGQVRDLVDERVEDKADEKLSQEIGHYLEGAEVRFEELKLELKRIKRKHERPAR